MKPGTAVSIIETDVNLEFEAPYQTLLLLSPSLLLLLLLSIGS